MCGRFQSCHDQDKQIHNTNYETGTFKVYRRQLRAKLIMAVFYSNVLFKKFSRNQAQINLRKAAQSAIVDNSLRIVFTSQEFVCLKLCMSTTVKPLLSGHPRGLRLCPLNRGCLLNRCLLRFVYIA